MFEISSDDIVEWADRYEAAAVLPKLVRRLISATSEVTALRFPADGGVRLRGFDGIIETSRGGRYVPDALSVWELTVEKQPLGKIARDFAKRSQSCDGRGAATYVAVVARRCADKDTWAADRRRETGWRNVRVIDAEDLATWLESAPAVAIWFASELGRPVAEAVPLADRAATWSRRSQVPIPIEALLLGGRRERAADQLRAWANTSGGGRITLRAPTVDEAVSFAAAALTSHQSDHPAENGVVIDGRGAWRWITRLAGGRKLLLVVDPSQVELGAAPADAKVIVPVDPSHAVGVVDIELSPVPWSALRELLARSGFDGERAERLARDCMGDLSALQRLLGHTGRPQWIDAAPVEELSALALLGYWDSHSEGDRDALKRLGLEPGALDATCAALAKSAGEPVVGHSDGGRTYWRFRSAADVWREIAPRLGADFLDRFVAVACHVLGEHDPKYDLPPEERWHAALHGKVRLTSPLLRRGIAESLVRLTGSPRPAGVRADEIARGAGVRVVHAALEPDSWVTWASADDVLPLLCESAPEAFVDAVEESLASGSEGVERLLSPRDAWGWSSHTGLMWAIELACWRPGLAPRAILAMAALAERDPGGTPANRPYSALCASLDPVFPESCTSAEQRAKLAERIVEHHPRVGWNLVVQCLRRAHGMISPARRPEIADWTVPTWPQRASANDAAAQLDAACSTALVVVERDPSRWPELVRTLLRLEPMFRGPILERLETIADALALEREAVRSAIRELLHLMRFGQSRERRDDLLPRLDALLERLAPTDPVENAAWLFTSGPVRIPDPTEDWREEQRKIAVRRRTAVDVVLAGPPDLDALARFAARIELPELVGVVLAEREDGIDWLEALVSSSPPRVDLAPVLARLVANLDRRGVSVLFDAVRRLHSLDRVDEAVLVARTARPSSELWDVLEELGGALSQRYWSPGVVLWEVSDAQDWSRALSQLIAAGAVASALEQAGHAASKSLIGPEQAMAILEAVAAASDENEVQRIVTNQTSGYHIEQLLDRVDVDPSMPAPRVAAVELALLPFLRHSRRKHRALGEAMAQDPAVFVEFLCMRYRDAREPPASAPEVPVHVQHAAERAYHVLHEWDGVPGRDGAGFAEDALRTWIDRAIELADERGRLGPAVSEIAQILARAPIPDDGVWPCLTARALVEAMTPRRIDRALSSARYNTRGVVTRSAGEGGGQEHELAANYRADAARVDADWPRTASLLRGLADTYEGEGRREDAEAASERERYGLDDPEASGSKARGEGGGKAEAK